MHDLQKRRLNTLQQVTAFFQFDPDLFTSGRIVGSLAQVIQAAYDELLRLYGAQNEGIGESRQQTRKKTEACESLRVSLMAIARTAGVIARTSPGFDEPFQLPKSKVWKERLPSLVKEGSGSQ